VCKPLPPLEPNLRPATVVQRLPGGRVLVSVQGVGTFPADNRARRAEPGARVNAVNVIGRGWEVV